MLFSFVLFSCSQEQDGIYFDETSTTPEVDETSTSATTADDTSSYSTMESEIIELVNEHRLSVGIPALKALTIVSTVADGHTKYMVETGDVGHAKFAERAEYLVKNAAAISVGENVAYGYHSAEAVMNGWLGSDGHRTNIENSKYTHIGIATESNSEGRLYFTQIFIKK